MSLLKLALGLACVAVICQCKAYKKLPNVNKDMLAVNGTTAKGAHCYFPFVYEGKLHYNCSEKHSPIAWCSTTFNYDKEQQWGYCSKRATIWDAGVVSADDVCASFFRENNTISYHAQYYHELLTSELCVNQCKIEPKCFGINFDRYLTHCFLGFTSAFFDASKAKNVDHYTKIKCEKSTTPGVTDKPTCVDDFSKTPNQIATGGIQKDASNPDECGKKCLEVASPEKCIGFIFNRVDLLCKIYTSAKDFATTGSNPMYDYYTRETCVPKVPCYHYNEYAGQMSYNGSIMFVETLEECKENCMKNKNCLAIDYSTSGHYHCFQHLDSSYANPDNVRENVANVVQYRKVQSKCPMPPTSPPPTVIPTTLPKGTTRPTPQPTTTPCEDKYLLKKNTYGRGGKRIVPNSVEECKKYCDLDVECKGFDYDHKQKACYTFNKSPIHVSETVDVDHYDKVKCDVEPAKTTFFPNTCTDTFTLSRNMHGPGTRSIPDHKTVKDCKLDCLSKDRETCGAFDFNKFNKLCFIIVLKKATNIRSLNGTDHYTRDNNCQDKTTPSPCKSTFKKHAKLHWFDGELDAGIHDLEECKDLCERQSKCVAIDYNWDSKSCYWYDDTKEYTVEELAKNDKTDSYEIERCHDGCKVTFTKKPSYHSRGGIEVPDTDFEACKLFCENHPSCLAIDFNPTNVVKCYYHVAGYLKYGEATTVENTQYKINRCPL